MLPRTATGAIVYGALAFFIGTPPAFAQSMQPGQWTLNMRVDHEGRSEALRQAMLAFLEDKADAWSAYPGEWAPFMIVGEGEG